MGCDAPDEYDDHNRKSSRETLMTDQIESSDDDDDDDDDEEDDLVVDVEGSEVGVEEEEDLSPEAGK